MKFKDSKLFIKLINNYVIDFGSDCVGLNDILEVEDWNMYTGKFNILKETYYPKKIIVTGWLDEYTSFYIVFKKKVKNNE